MAKIKAPNPKFEGETHFGNTALIFKEGVAETDSAAILEYAAAHGYGIEGATEGDPVEDQPRENPPGPSVPVDPRTVEDKRVGTAARDAAVDPRPGDFLPPTHAGEANPHGPLVNAPGIHAEGERAVRPGVVANDPDAQQAAETEHAERILTEQQPVGDVTGDPDRKEELADANVADTAEVTTPAPVDELRGQSLDDALTAAGLSTAGRVDEKRARLAEHRGQQA